jgi:hypothetical protein
LNGVLVTLNDGGLCREALWHWISNGWVVVAPHSPLVAMAGPELKPELKLRTFCGERAAQVESDEPEGSVEPTEAAEPAPRTEAQPNEDQ